MTKKERKAINDLHRQILSATRDAFELIQVIDAEIVTALLLALSVGDRRPLADVRLVLGKLMAQCRYARLRYKADRHIGKCKALVEISNRHLAALGVPAAVIEIDGCGRSSPLVEGASRDTDVADWSERMREAYEHLKSRLRASDSDVWTCWNTLLLLG